MGNGVDFASSLFSTARMIMKLFLDWSSYRNAGMGDAYADIPKHGGDFARAVAVCIGSRQCEQTGKGVMCPSYRVSLHPGLSPGGRIKALKAALNAEDTEAFFEPELAEAMALCVSCKGCKRECENEVDMALIKAEFLAQQIQHNGLQLRRRLWAELPKLLLWPGLRTLIAWRNRSPWLARLGEAWLGIGAKASLPLPAALPFTVPDDADDGGGQQVVLLVDTFNFYFNPAAAEAAHQLLTRAGYRVRIATPAGDDGQRPLCCGRTYFSNGLIERARQEAERMLAALEEPIAAGHAIIGLEPSCILSLRDEYLKLGLGEPAQRLAERVLLLEEFIVREQAANRWRLNFVPLPKVGKVMLQGHCHQKAVGALKSVRKLLKQIPELSFELIESSCCGMAGHFGLEAEHYVDSQAMAELALLPALRAKPDALLVSNGFSCQQQIVNAGFAQPLHLAQLLVAALPRQD